MAEAFPFKLHGRYRVESVFADGGGMGLVYAARDERLADNPVLIKTTRFDGGEHARQFKYTADEAVAHIEASRKILAWEKKMLVRFRDEGLNNIPLATDYFLGPSSTLMPSYQGKWGAYQVPQQVLGAEPYLVMEWIHGEVLEQKMLDPQWRQELEVRLLTMARELLTVLIKLHKTVEIKGHKANFLYQDLKPANILVGQANYFTLIDFGAVTMRLGGRTTEPTAGCITPGYAAPEGGRDAALLDERFDLYTLGATLWHVITRRDPRDLKPFEPLPTQALRQAGISQGFARIVSKALAPAPGSRYPSAAAMRKDVMGCLREHLT